MPLTRPSLSDIYTRMISDVETRFTELGSLLRRSVLRVLIKACSGAIHLLYGYIELMAKQLFVSTATGTYLDTIGAEYGIYRNPATKATGTCVATGTSGITIPSGTELQSSEGVVYVVDADVTIASGSATLALTAKYEGDDTNNEGSIILSFTSPITSVNSTATVASDGLSGGADQEIDDDYRSRILARKRFPPHGGCSNDYIAWTKEISGVTRAWCFPNYIGLGTVGIAFMRDDDAVAIPNSTQRDAMETYIQEHTDPTSGQVVGCPVTATNGIDIIALEELEVNLTIKIYPKNSTVEAAVTSEIEAILLSDGGPGQTLRLSRIGEAISNAAGEIHHSIVYPTSDIPASYTQVHVLGTVTYQVY